MKTVYKFYKNSNTEELLMSQEFTETNIKNIPIYFYNVDRKKVGENLDLKGFVEINEKKFNRYSKKKP
jgi:hypothetical protein